MITYEGEDQDVIWKKEKTQLSTEFWDAKLGHYPHENENYWINGIPEKDVGKVFNIESQFGVFSGLTLVEFDKNIKFLNNKLNAALFSKTLATDSKSFSLFGYTEYSDWDVDVPHCF